MWHPKFAKGEEHYEKGRENFEQQFQFKSSIE
jgi:hypothetical protein